MHSITDEWGRSFRTLRVSLTGNCNLACTYCVSDLKAKTDSRVRKGILSVDELFTIISSLHLINPLDTVRLTGGEPLLYKGAERLVERLKDLSGIRVKMTTNGVLLKDKISSFKKAGIDSVNVSLDAMDEEIFFRITKRRDLSKVLSGIEAAVKEGIPVKINSVIVKGVNENEIIPLLEYGERTGAVVRFLEVMPMGHLNQNFSNLYVSEKEILERVEKVNSVYPLERAAGSTANYWIGKKTGTFGIISNISNPFCKDCTRLRLDSMGNIFGCLSSNKGFNIRDIIKDEKELAYTLKKALAQKQSVFKGSDLSMKAIGG
jgi:cyclic pyranopterin phosphate synthase